MASDAAGIRREYTQGGLDRPEVADDPLRQFEQWYHDAVSDRPLDPTAMTLATATPDGRPSARVVLLKDFDERGYTFYTNYLSHKGQELEANPRAALVFWWDRHERQVRIEGRVSRVADEESDAYFKSRPLGSRLGAWASAQSQVIESRAWLEERMKDVEARFAGMDVPRPDFWGGYRVVPEQYEFWQGRQSRLHDRFRYRMGAGGVWAVERLSP